MGGVRTGVKDPLGSTAILNWVVRGRTLLGVVVIAAALTGCGSTGAPAETETLRGTVDVDGQEFPIPENPDEIGPYPDGLFEALYGDCDAKPSKGEVSMGMFGDPVCACIERYFEENIPFSEYAEMSTQPRESTLPLVSDITTQCAAEQAGSGVEGR